MTIALFIIAFLYGAMKCTLGHSIACGLLLMGVTFFRGVWLDELHDKKLIKGQAHTVSRPTYVQKIFLDCR